MIYDRADADLNISKEVTPNPIIPSLLIPICEPDWALNEKIQTIIEFNSSLEVILCINLNGKKYDRLVSELLTRYTSLICIRNNERVSKFTLHAQALARSSRNHAVLLDNFVFTPCEKLLSYLRECVEEEVKASSVLLKSEFKELSSNSLNLDNAPDVSVIIPVHNVESYIEKCLDSLTSQTLKKIEFILVDDGSSDRSVEIVERYSLRDRRIKLIECNIPSGSPGTPRNIGIAAAQGTYIGFVDSDDWVEEKMYEKLCFMAKNADLDIVSATSYFMEENGSTKKIQFDYITLPPIDNDEDKVFYSGHFSHIWPRIYRKSLLLDNGIFFPKVYFSEDFCFSFVCHARAIRTGKIDECFYHYRYNRPSSTTNQRQKQKGFAQVLAFQSILDYFKSFEIYDRYESVILQKSLGSFWYTYERIDKSLKEEFLAEMRAVFGTFTGKFDAARLSEREANQIKLLGLEFKTRNQTTGDENKMLTIAMENNATVNEGSIGSLKSFAEANRLMRERKFLEARRIYEILAPTFISASVNSSIISLLMGDIGKARLTIREVGDKKISEPIKRHIKREVEKRVAITESVSSKNPLISIIVPVYNASKYLLECLTSVLNQTYSNIEVLVVNDGSTDNSQAIIDEIAARDNRIVVLKNERASGNPGTPRNLALRAISGDFVSFVDSDDWIEIDYIEKLVSSYDGKADIVFASGYIDCVGEKRVTRAYKNIGFNDPVNPLYRYHESFTIWDKLYRAKFLIENSILLGETQAAVDVPFIFKAYYYCSSAVFCTDNNGYYYRRESDSSVTLNKRRKSNCDFEFAAYRNVEAWADSENVPSWYADLVDVKKVNSYLYTLTLIGEQFKEDFKKRARNEFQKLESEKIESYLRLLNRKENILRFKAIAK